MKISEFINDDFFNLPKTRETDKDFRHYVFETLDKFIKRLNGIDNFEDIGFPIAQIIERQEHLIKQIKNSINYYYEGRPASALNSLGRGLNSDSKNFEELMYLRRFESDNSFYRIRIHNENFPLPPYKFFHIPFELRGKVKTQRYSIPGFPSLYLGTTVYVCWEELNRPNINDFQVVRLKNTAHIRVLNMRPSVSNGTSPNRLYNYLMLWPLIFASSIKVNNDKDTFKPEYIIPQLLLQWVRKNEKIDGIMYETTHIEKHKTESKGEFINIVLPVKENKQEGLCSKLCAKFEMSSSLSFQLDELSSGNVIDGGTFNEPDVNEKIQELEIVKGQKLPYSYSMLGKLESRLLKMETMPIPPNKN